VCPLEPAVGGHKAGDTSCHFARTAVKSGGPERVVAVAGERFAAALLAQLPEYRERHPKLAKVLDAAAQSPIKGARLFNPDAEGATDAAREAAA
jgi:hypothetical protein